MSQANVIQHQIKSGKVVCDGHRKPSAFGRKDKMSSSPNLLANTFLIHLPVQWDFFFHFLSFFKSSCFFFPRAALIRSRRSKRRVDVRRRFFPSLYNSRKESSCDFGGMRPMRRRYRIAKFVPAMVTV